MPAMAHQDYPNSSMDEDQDLGDTSYSEHGSESEFEVEDVLGYYEETGAYLVKWTNYGLERATLEPPENLPDNVMEIWKEKQRQILNGQREPFPIEAWNQACAHAYAQKERRAVIREARRERQARREKKPKQAPPRVIDDSSSSEAAEVDEIMDAGAHLISASKTKVRQTIFSAGTSSTDASPALSFDLLPLKQLQQQQQQQPQQKTRPTAASASVPPSKRAKDKEKAKEANSNEGKTTSTLPKSKAQQAQAQAQTNDVAVGRKKPVSETVPKTRQHANTITSTSTANTKASSPVLPQKRNSIGNRLPAEKTSTSHPQLQRTQTQSTLPRPLPPRTRARRPSTLGALATGRASTHPQSVPPTSGALAAIKSTTGTFITPQMTSDLKPASKRPTAKKSNNTKYGNVFSGGKKRQDRKSSMADKIQGYDRAEPDGVFFSNAHVMRKAELSSRQAAEGPVQSLDKIPSKLQGPHASGVVDGAQAEASNQTNEPSPSVLFVESIPPSEDAEQARVCIKDEPEADSEQPKKRRKGVRFADDLAPTEEPMEISRDVPKSITVGSVVRESFQVIFEDVTQNDDEPRVTSFQQAGTLDFGLLCHPPDVEHGKSKFNVKWKPLYHGSLRPYAAYPGSFEMVLERMRTGDVGLVHAATESPTPFSIVVYPPESEPWRALLGRDQISAPRQAILNYCIMDELPDGPKCAPKSQTPQVKHLPEFMEMFFGWNYENLLPPKAKEGVFYLLIPETVGHLYPAIGRWILACNESSKVFSSRSPGSWQAFLGMDTGVVIIHHSLMRMIRCIPELADILRQGQHYQVWLVNDLVEQSALTKPSIHHLSRHRLSISRLFPTGLAILLTPSFVLTEPQRTLDVLKWYQRTRGRQYTSTLVAAANFPEYLVELCTEHLNERDKLHDEIRDPGRRMQEEERRRITPELIQMRFDAMQIVRSLLSTDTVGNVKEELSSLITAPLCIDANDEQSLVNWFGYWSDLNLEKYRKFFVIGTVGGPHWNEQLASRIFKIPRFGRRMVGDPDVALARSMARGFEADLDEETTIQPEPPVYSEEDAGHGAVLPSPLQAQMSLSPSLPPIQSSTQPSVTISSPSKMFATDHATELQGVLKGIHARYSMGTPFWHLYNRPVSWDSDAMNAHFECNVVDPRFNYERFRDWWQHCFRFHSKGSKGPRFNTYIGLFYTIDGEWDVDKYPRGLMPKLHPWLAIYRPRRPHDSKWFARYGTCELMIWDPYAERRFRDPTQPTLAELPYMQRKLYEWVRDNTGTKNSNSVLQQVFYGGWDWPTCESTHPLDVTIMHLRELVDNYKKHIPPEEVWMEGAGWRKLETRDLPVVSSQSTSPQIQRPVSPPLLSPPAAPPPVSPPMAHSPDAVGGPGLDDHSHGAAGEPYSVEELQELQDPEVKLVFHAPNAGGVWKSKRVASKCQNRLYRKTQEVLDIKKNAEVMRFCYVPTLKWYGLQVDEGRDYSYINVVDWETAFRMLEVKVNAREVEGE